MRILISLLFVTLIANNANAVVLVNDETNMLTVQQTQELTHQLLELQNQNVLVQATLTGNLNGVTVADRAYQIRRTLEQINPNVVVMLVAWNDRKAFIATSGGAKNLLPDSFIESVFKNELTPNLKRNDIAGAFAASARAINNHLVNTPLTSSTTVQQNPVQQNSDGSYLLLFLLLGCGAIAIGIYLMHRKSMRQTNTYTREYPYSPSSYRPSSRYNTRSYREPRSSGSTNVFAPIIVDNSTDVVNPSVSSTPSTHSSNNDSGGGFGGSWGSSSSSSSSSDSGGGYGGSFDSGGGSGGGFDGGGGSGGDF